MAITLILGGVAFEESEVSDQVILRPRRGPSSAHILDRVVVVDPREIAWHGCLGHPAAEQRARTIEAFWQAGDQLRLSLLGFNFTVVITLFDANYEVSSNVPYSIKCSSVDEPIENERCATSGKNRPLARRALTSLAKLLGRQAARTLHGQPAEITSSKKQGEP